VCGQHIKVLSFPYSRVPSTLVEMLQSTKLDPIQLRNTMPYMRCLKTLELWYDDDMKQLFSSFPHLQKLTIHTANTENSMKCLQPWIDAELKPSSFNVITHSVFLSIITSLYEINWPTTLPTTAIGHFRFYLMPTKVPFNLSCKFPFCHYNLKDLVKCLLLA